MSLAFIVEPALRELAMNFELARDVQCNPWQFAVEIGRLTAGGTTSGALRWLVAKGYFEHAVEVTQPCDTTRKFRSAKTLAFTRRSCFSISEAGLSLVGRDSVGEVLPVSPRCDPATLDLPRWDGESHVLYARGQIVKQFRVPSPSQELILAAFQEEGWPRIIFDPLVPSPNQVPKQRLRETIRCLNRNQKNRLVRFQGDGSGQGVGWQLIDAAALPLPLGRQESRPAV